MNYNDNGEVKPISIKAGDSLPIGTVVEFEGSTIPAGYVEVDSVQQFDVSQYKTSEVLNITRAIITKSGNIYHIDLAITPSSTGNNKILFSLPEHLRPSFNTELSNVNNNQQTCRCLIESTGNIVLSNAQATATYINGVFIK